MHHHVLANDPPTQHRMDVWEYRIRRKENCRFRSGNRRGKYLCTWVSCCLPSTSFWQMIFDLQVWASQIYQAKDAPGTSFLITATLDQYCNLLVIPQILKSEMSSTSLFLEPRLFCGLSRRHTTNTVIERMRRFAKGWAMRSLRRKKRIWKSGETLAHYLSLRHKVQFERVDSAPCKWNYVMP